MCTHSHQPLHLTNKCVEFGLWKLERTNSRFLQPWHDSCSVSTCTGAHGIRLSINMYVHIMLYAHDILATLATLTCETRELFKAL
jgi:hypothetical protein